MDVLVGLEVSVDRGLCCMDRYARFKRAADGRLFPIRDDLVTCLGEGRPEPTVAPRANMGFDAYLLKAIS